MTKWMFAAMSFALLAFNAATIDGAQARTRAGKHHKIYHHAARSGGTASISCLTPAARNLWARITSHFGNVQAISTCRPGATVRDTGRPSRHASGNAIDFMAPGNKGTVVAWLIANHGDGGTMTYSNSDHIHVDIGPHWVSLAGGTRLNYGQGQRQAFVKVQHRHRRPVPAAN